MKGQYILVEGIDGTGKTQTVYRLSRHFNEVRRSHFTYAEPTRGRHGLEARRKVTDGDYESPNELIDLFIKDREEGHRNTINDIIDSDGTVIQDRGFLSTAAYQSSDFLQAMEIIQRHVGVRWFRLPTNILILKCDPKVAIQRISEEGRKKTSFERVDFLRAVQERFESAAQHLIRSELPCKINFIDTTHRTLGDVVQLCLECLENS